MEIVLGVVVHSGWMSENSGSYPISMLKAQQTLIIIRQEASDQISHYQGWVGETESRYACVVVVYVGGNR